MKKYTFTALFACLLAVMLVLAACGQSASSVPAQPSTGAGASSQPVANSGEDFDPMAPYEETVTITFFGAKNDSIEFSEGEDYDNNLWTQHYLDELNIQVEYIWLVDGTQYDQQVALSVASQNLPDIMTFNRNNIGNMYTLLEADRLTDLTDIYDRYLSDLSKEIINYDGGTGLSSCYSGDMMFALPSTNPSTDSAPMMWIRDDWLAEVDLGVPTTTDELLALAAAFAEGDFDGQDTYGIAIYNELFDGLCGLNGFFNGYYAYAEQWINNGDGLVYGGITDEARHALEALAGLYAGGHLDREFIVKDANAVAADLTSGKVGITFGPQWLPIWPLNSGIESSETYDWTGYPLPTTDGEYCRPLVPIGVNAYYTVNSEFEHPEALAKMMNLYVNDAFGDGDSTYFVTSETHHEPFKLARVALMQPDKNIACWRLCVDALENGNTEPLQANAEALGYYESILNYQQDPTDSAGWAYQRIFGVGGSIGILEEYEQKNALIINEYYGPTTPSMETKQATLDKMQLETYTKIITGEDDISAFDTFVEQWYALGGQDITDEVNAWYSALQ